MKLILLIIVLTFNQICYSQWQYHKNIFNINEIEMEIDNEGGIDYATGIWKRLNQSGILYQNNSIVYDQGLILVGKINNYVQTAHRRWASIFRPGPIINNQAAYYINPQDSNLFRTYKLTKGKTTNSDSDYVQWPKQFGAPVDINNNPIIYADQTIWTIYQGIDSTKSQKWWLGNGLWLPVEVHQLVYGYNNKHPQNVLSHTIFFEYLIINKGTETIDSLFIGLWNDIDFYLDLVSNIPAVDTTLQLGYCWGNFWRTEVDTTLPIPAVGYQLLHGPLVPSVGDTAVFKGKKRANFKNLKLSSFHGMNDDASNNLIFGNDNSMEQLWNRARGLDRDGKPIIDSTTMLPTKFPSSGDPVTKTGFLYPYNTSSGGAGFTIYSGPVTLAQNDTQWVQYALIPEIGENNLNSITKLRNSASIIKNLRYDQLVKIETLVPQITEVNIPEYFSLSQNYPNPFNPNTKIEYEIPLTTFVSLKIYDIMGNEVATLVNETQEADKYSVNFDFNKIKGGLSSGVYFYTLDAWLYRKTKKMLFLK